MPDFDLPWDALQTYRGRNPRPADFDDYWSAAMHELEAIPPDVEITPADYSLTSAECLDLWFTGLGGARVYAKYLRSRAEQPNKPAIVMFHGYSGRSPDWSSLLPYAAEGYSVLAMDCRGQGGRSLDVGGPMRQTLHGHIVRGLLEGPAHLLYRSVFTDAARAVHVLMDQPDVDATRVGVTGASQGGALTVAAAALAPDVKAAAPVYPFLSDYQRVWELDLAEQAYGELREWLRRFDPRHELDLFATLGYIDIQNLAPRIRGQVLWAIGLMDTICPPSTQFAAYNKITAPKSMVVYPDFEHETLPDLTDRVLSFFAATL